MDELLKQAVGLEEPLKSRYVVEVWQHFDAVNSLLRSAELGEDIELAVSKTITKKRHVKTYLPQISVLTKYLSDNLHP